MARTPILKKAERRKLRDDVEAILAARVPLKAPEPGSYSEPREDSDEAVTGEYEFATPFGPWRVRFGVWEMNGDDHPLSIHSKFLKHAPGGGTFAEGEKRPWCTPMARSGNPADWSGKWNGYWARSMAPSMAELVSDLLDYLEVPLAAPVAQAEAA